MSRVRGGDAMLKWGLEDFLLAFASGVLGVSDPNAATAIIAQFLFFGNVVLFVVFTLLGAMTAPTPESESARGGDN
jgi:uncharacterized membrane protein YtjA (UPF0391 family)